MNVSIWKDKVFYIKIYLTSMHLLFSFIYFSI